MALSAALILWLTRGTSFFSDEFTYFVASRGFEPRALLSPHNGHLIAGTRLIYAGVFALFGADYLVFRLLEAFGVALVGALFFVLAKRRVGPAVALAPSVLLLFLGSAADDTLSPLGITHVYCIAAGLGALIALDRGDGRGDLMGCALLVAAVATFSIGLAFLAGGTVSVLLRRDRWRRAWIFLIPLALYGAWLLAAPKLSGPVYLADTQFRLSNALLVPNFVADAAAAVAGAVSGLAYNFGNPPAAAAGSAPDITAAWFGYPIAAIAAAALLFRIRLGPVRRSLWVSMAILFAFWASTAMVATINRYPFSERYVYGGAVAVLLVAADASAGIRLSRRLAPALLVATVLAVGANLAIFRTASAVLRRYSATSRAELTAIELARGHVDPTFVPPAPSLAFAYAVVGGAGPVLDAVDRNGSFAFSLAELRAQSERTREVADRALAAALGLHLVPDTAPAHLRCRQPSHLAKGGLVVLHSPGAVLRSPAHETVMLGRFARTPTAEVGSLEPGGPAILRLPADRGAQAWRVAVSPPGQLTLCAAGA